jgi:hypothetical protein
MPLVRRQVDSGAPVVLHQVPACESDHTRGCSVAAVLFLVQCFYVWHLLHHLKTVELQVRVSDPVKRGGDHYISRASTYDHLLQCPASRPGAAYHGCCITRCKTRLCASWPLEDNTVSPKIRAAALCLVRKSLVWCKVYH